MLLAIVFHDFYYLVSQNHRNEFRSAELMRNRCSHLPKDAVDRAYAAIMATKDHLAHLEDPDSVVRELVHADVWGLIHGDIDELLRVEGLVAKEFQQYPRPDYVRGRLEFLSRWKEYGRVPELIRHVVSSTPSTCVMVLRRGMPHEEALAEAQRLERTFDKVILFDRDAVHNWRMVQHREYRHGWSTSHVDDQQRGVRSVLIDNPGATVVLCFRDDPTEAMFDFDVLSSMGRRAFLLPANLLDRKLTREERALLGM